MDEILGVETDWIAVDAVGCVGFFSTAGGGDVPEIVLSYLDQCESAIDCTLALPESTQPLIAPKLAPALRNMWADLAARGWFAFDSDCHGGPYRCVAVPAVAVHVDELPERVKIVARRYVFNLHFSGAESVGKSDMDKQRTES